MAFKDFEAADLCVTKMNNRWYAGKQLEVTHWDGLMDFQVYYISYVLNRYLLALCTEHLQHIAIVCVCVCTYAFFNHLF